MKNYDLIIIGAGGGTKIASPAAALGKKVAIIEKEALGGTCLNRGCIPSKMLIHPANVLTQARDTQKFNITPTGDYEVDFGGLTKRVSDLVDGESAGIGRAYEKNDNIDHYAGEAKFVDQKVLEVNGEQITSDTIVLAVGSRSFVPPIPGLEGTPYMTSREALRRENLPKRLLIIGGGYIASELGHMYSALGSETVFFVRDVYLEHEDETISEAFQKVFEKKHKSVYGTQDLTVHYENNEFTLTGKDADGNEVRETGDALLMATGVRPNTDTLDLEKAGVETNERGYINTNERLETNVPGIYGIGDCIGRYLFRHSTNFEAEYLFGQLYGGEEAVDIAYPPMPHAVFTNPEIAGVGKTEKQLRDEGVDYLVARHEYLKSAQGMARLPEEGFVKLMFDRQTKQLLGAHIMGEEAATMIHHLILGMTLGATAEDYLKMIYIHPALPEIVRNAIRTAAAELYK